MEPCQTVAVPDALGNARPATKLLAVHQTSDQSTSIKPQTRAYPSSLRPEHIHQTSDQSTSIKPADLAVATPVSF
eukprot:353822-Chlamydomonas_euryale.AAC.7